MPGTGGQSPFDRERKLSCTIKWDNGTQSSVDIPGDVHVIPGDRLILVAGENQAAKRWHWAGLLNLTTHEQYAFGAPGEIVKARGEGILGKIGHLIISFSMIGGQIGLVIYLILGAIISALIASAISGRNGFLSNWIIIGILLGAVSTIDFIKALRQVGNAPKDYNEAIGSYLRTVTQENMRLLSAAS